MMNYEITQTRQSREGKGRRWVTDSTSTEVVNEVWVKRFMDAVPFFRGLGGKESTVGSKSNPVKHTSTSPDGLHRVITEFKEVL